MGPCVEGQERSQVSLLPVPLTFTDPWPATVRRRKARHFCGHPIVKMFERLRFVSRDHRSVSNAGVAGRFAAGLSGSPRQAVRLDDSGPGVRRRVDRDRACHVGAD
jgi:hypothetical protein